MSPTNYFRGLAALAACAAAATLSGCPSQEGPRPPPGADGFAAMGSAKAGTPEAFVAQVNKDLIDLNREGNAAGWTQATDITVDTQYLNARVTDRALEYYSRKAAEAKAFDGQKLEPSTARSLMLLKLGVSAPAPADAAKRAELAGLTTELDAMYGEGKYCPPGKTVLKAGKDEKGCNNLDAALRHHRREPQLR